MGSAVISRQLQEQGRAADRRADRQAVKACPPALEVQRQITEHSAAFHRAARFRDHRTTGAIRRNGRCSEVWLERVAL